jgi:hypothetical protein
VREKDDLNKGKDDWMSYKNKLNQIREDKNADKENNEKIAQNLEKKREASKEEIKKAIEAKKEKEKRNYKPGGGLNLG